MGACADKPKTRHHSDYSVTKEQGQNNVHVHRSHSHNEHNHHVHAQIYRASAHHDHNHPHHAHSHAHHAHNHAHHDHTHVHHAHTHAHHKHQNNHHEVDMTELEKEGSRHIRSQKQLQQLINSFFDKYDTDQDGYLDKQGVGKMMEDIYLHTKNHKHKFSSQQIDEFMADADIDHDHLINKSDLYLFYKGKT